MTPRGGHRKDISLRSFLIEELVPPGLDEPVLLSSRGGGGGGYQVEPTVLALAARRRKILQAASQQARQVLESASLAS
jgi:hypothetical protein